MKTSPTPRSADHELETVVFTSGTAIAVVYGRACAFAAGAILCLGTSLWLQLNGHEAWARITLVVTAILAVIAGTSVLWSYLRHRGISVLVTTLGVIRRRKRLFSLIEETILLSAVEAVRVRQNFLGMMFGFGAVIISAGDQSVEWRDIANPRRVAEEIKAHQGHEHKDPPLGECE